MSEADDSAARAAEKRRMLMDILNVRLTEAHRVLLSDYDKPAAPRPRPEGPLRGGQTS